MNQRPNTPHTHFHISWNSRKHMDWECFDTYDSAVIRALELALPGEGLLLKKFLRRVPFAVGVQRRPGRIRRPHDDKPGGLNGSMQHLGRAF